MNKRINKKDYPNGLQVEVRNNNIEKALRHLKQLLKENDWILALRKNDFYRKPSDIRREKKAKSRARIKHQQKKNNL